MKLIYTTENKEITCELNDSNVPHSDLVRLLKQIQNINFLMARPGFLAKASLEVKDNERKKLKDFTMKYNAIVAIVRTELLQRLGDAERILWHIQYMREEQTELERYSDPWFEFVYDPEIQEHEFINLHQNLFK